MSRLASFIWGSKSWFLPKALKRSGSAVRQHAVAASNLTQKVQKVAEEVMQTAGGEEKAGGNIALIEVMRKIAMNVRDLDMT